MVRYTREIHANYIELEPLDIVDISNIRIYPNDDIRIDTWSSNIFLDKVKIADFIELLQQAQRGYEANKHDENSDHRD